MMHILKAIIVFYKLDENLPSPEILDYKELNLPANSTLEDINLLLSTSDAIYDSVKGMLRKKLVKEGYFDNNHPYDTFMLKILYQLVILYPLEIIQVDAYCALIECITGRRYPKGCNIESASVSNVFNDYNITKWAAFMDHDYYAPKDFSNPIKKAKDYIAEWIPSF